MHKSRYVVMQKDGEWQIKNAYRHVTSTFPSKAQALCAAIELAEKDGNRGHEPEVLVRHEDDRFITEWVYGQDLHPRRSKTRWRKAARTKRRLTWQIARLEAAKMTDLSRAGCRRHHHRRALLRRLTMS